MEAKKMSNANSMPPNSTMKQAVQQRSATQQVKVEAPVPCGSVGFLMQDLMTAFPFNTPVQYVQPPPSIMLPPAPMMYQMVPMPQMPQMSQMLPTPQSSEEEMLASLKHDMMNNLDKAIQRGELSKRLKQIAQGVFNADSNVKQGEQMEMMVEPAEEIHIDGRVLPFQQLQLKADLCDSESCLRCKFNSSSGSGSTQHSGPDVVVTAQTVVPPKITLPANSCGFCYVHYKRHCQRLGNPWPRIEDPGFWHGHSTKDENGDVMCPELRNMRCSLCFASGSKAHTARFCPLNNLPQANG